MLGLNKMKDKKTSEKTSLHPRNPHRFRYDFEQLLSACPELKEFVFVVSDDSGLFTKVK